MARSLPAEVITALDSDKLTIAVAMSLSFGGTVVNMWTGYNDITIGTTTFLGNGWVQSISELTESESSRTTSLEITLAGASTEVNSLALGKIRHADTGYFYLLLLSESGVPVGDPYLFFMGPIDTCALTDDDKTTVVRLTYLSDITRLEEAIDYKYTDQVQQTLYPGDVGFQYVGKVEDWSGYWGKMIRPKNKPDKKKSSKTDKKRTVVSQPSRAKEPKLIRLSSGVYRTASGKIVWAKGSSTSQKSASKKIKRTPVTGKEVTGRSSNEARQVVYGRVKTGGTLTFIETSSESFATKATGSGNSQIVWIARTAGSAGNAISIEIVCTGTQAAIAVYVAGTDIQVRVKSSSGTSQSTADQVIAAIRANGFANALVAVHNGDGNGNALVQSEDQGALAGGGGTWLHNYVTLAGHEIEDVESLFLGKELVPLGGLPDGRWATGKFAGKVFMAKVYGTTDQLAQQDLVNQLPTKWTANHRQQGCAGAYLIFIWDSFLFPEGWPDIYFIIKGKKVYDPRTATTVWSDNAALIIADYLTDTNYGMAIPYSNIDEAQLIIAANICDETITISGGPTEARYTINGFFDMSRTRRSVLQDMEQSIAGTVVQQGGEWFIYPGKYISPVMTITDDDIRGVISVATLRSRDETFNRVKGTYVNPDDDYNATDFAPVINSYYETQDGQVLWEEANFPFINRSGSCQRIAKIHLEKMRQGMVVTLGVSLMFFQLQVTDTVYVTLLKYGWTNKIFEVVDLSLDFDSENGMLCSLVLNETASTCYDWNDGEETRVDPAPDTNLPDPWTVGAPTDLVLTSGTDELYMRSDGTIFSRLKVSWTPPTDEFVLSGGTIEIQHKIHSRVDWSSTTEVSGSVTFYHILEVSDGVTYDVQIRAKNGLGVVSSWVQAMNHVVVGKTEPPSDVDGFSGQVNGFGIGLNWNPVPDLDVSRYQIRFGSTWASANYMGEVQGASYQVPILTAGTYSYLIKAIDTSGNYSLNAAPASVTITGPSAPSLSWGLNQVNMVLSWTVPASPFAIDSYNIYYGNTFGSATLFSNVKGTSLSTQANWSGNRRWWVAAVDIAGNIGAAGGLDVFIQAPGVVGNLRADVIDNNVLLYWNEPTVGSLPISSYHIRRGAIYASATLIGDCPGTFQVVFEMVGGAYTYWICAVDTGGNEGVPVGLGVTVNQPPDFVLHNDVTLTLTDATTLTNCFVNDDGTNSLLLPVDKTETFAAHFTTYSRTTPDEQLAAGLPLYLQPSLSTATYEQTHDFLATISNTIVNLSWTAEYMDGSVTVVPTLSYSTDGSTWTDSSETRVVAAAVRYVKVHLVFTAVDTSSLVKLHDVRITCSVKEITDGGMGTVGTPAASGEVVTFNKTFIDVQSIIVSPASGGSAVSAIYDWGGDPDTTFIVYLLDSAGGFVVGDFSWSARGV